MILLNDKKINIFSEKNKINFNMCKCMSLLEKEIEDYEGALNFGYIECPCCHSDDLISYGSYERNVVVSIYSHEINIRRVMCNNCGRTHALIPSFLKPYFQYESSFIDFLIILIFVRKKKNKEIENRLNLSRQLLRKWKLRFEEHRTRLLVYKNLSLEELLCEVFLDDFLSCYYERNKVYYFSKITNITFS